jgi:hypothetical protein
MKQISQHMDHSPVIICNRKQGHHSDHRICKMTLSEICYNPVTSTFLSVVGLAWKSSHTQHMLLRVKSTGRYKDTTESSPSASYLYILMTIDAGGKVTIQLYDKRDYFNFAIVIFPYICSNIPLSPAYGVHISQLIRYARACSAYDQFLIQGTLLAHMLISQGFLQSRLMSAFRKFYGRYNDLIHNYKLSLSHNVV